MSPSFADPILQDVLAWCVSTLGPCEVVSGDPRFHGRTLVCRLRTPDGFAYLKIHRDRSFWENEVHGHENWAPAFGKHTPRLLAVREDEPLALVTGELEGQLMQKVQLEPAREERAWHAAGRALANLHRLPQGTFFGMCQRDGSPAQSSTGDALAYVDGEFARLLQEGADEDCLTDREQAIVHRVQGLVSSFEGEPPTACHRDYGPDNWLVTEDSAWSGVIDYEFAHWDVRVADFSRYPNWEWIERPELVEAFLEGYGRPLTPREEEQCLVARTRYALSAITWGRQAAFYGFEAEGRRAIAHIGDLVG